MDLLRYLPVFLAATVGGVVAGLPVLSLGLVVSAVVVFPLAFLFAAVVAAVSALWAGNLAASGPARGRPAPVLAFSLATASAVTALLLLLGLVGAPMLAYVPPGYLLILNAALVALGATVATRRYREEGRSPRRDALFTLAALAVSVAVLVAVLFVTCAFGYCGA